MIGIGLDLQSRGILAGAGVPTTPASPSTFSGLLRWHSVPALTGISDGAAVASLPDLSPANDPAVQATTAAKPIYSATAANGRPGLQMNGTSHYMTYTRVATVQTLICVASFDDPQANDYGPLAGDSSSFDLAGPVKTLPWLIDTATVGSAKYNAPVRINGIDAGPLAIMSRPNNLTVFTVRMPAGQTMALANISRDRVNPRYMKGVQCDAASFNRLLSDAECARVEKYFCNFYGITYGAQPTYGSRANSVHFGDSQTSALGATLSYPVQLAGLVGTTKLSISVLGAPNTTAQQWRATYLDQYLYNFNWVRLNKAMQNVFWVRLATNDLFLGRTPAQAYDDLKWIWATLRPLGKVAAFTVESRSNPGTPGNFNTLRASLNTMIRSDPSLYDYLVDVAADPTMGPDGAELNTTYFSDLVHETNAGLAIVAGLCQPALSAMGL